MFAANEAVGVAVIEGLQVVLVLALADSVHTLGVAGLRATLGRDRACLVHGNR